jgi:hypothetical protein
VPADLARLDGPWIILYVYVWPDSQGKHVVTTLKSVQATRVRTTGTVWIHIAAQMQISQLHVVELVLTFTIALALLDSAETTAKLMKMNAVVCRV